MARLPLVDEIDPALDEETRAALQEARAARGRLANVTRALANRPAALRAVTGLTQAVYRKDSTLEPRRGERACLTATTIDDCCY